MYQTNQEMPQTPATSLLAPRVKILLAALSVVAGGLVVLDSSILLFLLTAVGVATFALLWRDAANPLYLLAFPIAYVIGLSITGFSNFLLPVETLTVPLGGLLLGMALRAHARRTTQVLLVALGIAFPLLVVLAIQFIRANGIPGLEQCKEMIANLRAEIVAVVQESVNAALADLPQEELAMYQSLFSKEVIGETVRIMLICLPALLAVVVLIAAYLATALYVQTVRICRAERYLPDAPYVVTMSLPAAILYVPAFLLTSLLSNASMLWAVSVNLLILLLPGFALMAGQRYFWRRRHGLLGRWGQTAFFLVIVLLFISPYSAVTLMGLCGAYEVIDLAIRRMRRKGK